MDGRLSWAELGGRPALFPAAAFVAGAWFLWERAGLTPIFLAAGLLSGLGVVLLRGRPGAHLCLLSAFALSGALLATLRARVQLPPLESAATHRVEAVVDSAIPLGESTRLEASLLRIDGVPVHARARLYGRGALPPLQPGQRILARTRLKPIPGAANWGEADQRQRLARDGLVLTGGVERAGLVLLSPPSPSGLWVARTREALASRVRALSPSPEAAGVYLTLAAGLRAELGDGLEQRFSASGLAHVLSVSGLHVAVLALVVLWALRWLLVRTWPLARRVDARRVAAPLAIPLVWAYVAFTGWQMPAVRSAVMASGVLLGMALWRRSDALNGLSCAAVLLVAVDPACVADLSTQLSFLAVLSLIVLAPAIRAAVPLPRPEPGGPHRLRSLLARAGDSALTTFCASAAVTLASAPLIARVFHRLSVAGLLSNVVCLPLCAVLTLLAAGGAALFVVFPPLATPLLWLGAWASELLVRAVDLFAQLPGASLPVSSFGLSASLLFLGGLFVWALGRGRWRWGGLLAPGALACAYLLPVLWPSPGLTVTFLSVGHGDAIVLSSRGHHALVDGGGVPGGADTGRRFVLPFLREERISRLELAVLSHPHPDHALGLASTLAAIPTARLWLPAGDEGGELVQQVKAAARPAPVEEVEAGHPAFQLGEARIEVLGPPRDRVLLEGVNDRSVVLRVRHGEVSILLMGDVEEAGEEALDPGEVTVLKVPHHGSRTSSSPPFLARVRPEIAIFCVGLHNRFGFPDEEVVARYQALGARCYRTDLHGAVRVHSDGHRVEVTTFLSPALAPAGLDLARAEADPHPSGDDP